MILFKQKKKKGKSQGKKNAGQLHAGYCWYEW
jgi:hypothetical protein